MPEKEDLRAQMAAGAAALSQAWVCDSFSHFQAHKLAKPRSLVVFSSSCPRAVADGSNSGTVLDTAYGLFWRLLFKLPAANIPKPQGPVLVQPRDQCEHTTTDQGQLSTLGW